MKNISVIITAFKAYNFIEETLDSIMRQTILNELEYEILVGVDACVETLNKLKEIRYKYPNMRVFMMNENKGTYITRNTLLDLVKHDNILFFDSDDIMRDYMFDVLRQVHDKGDIFRYRGELFGGGVSGKETDLSHGTFMMKKKCLDVIGGFLDNRFGCDTEILQRASFGCKVIGVNVNLFYYRQGNPNQLTRTHLWDERRVWASKYIKSRYEADELYVEPIKNEFEEIG